MVRFLVAIFSFCMMNHSISLLVHSFTTRTPQTTVPQPAAPTSPSPLRRATPTCSLREKSAAILGMASVPPPSSPNPPTPPTPAPAPVLSKDIVSQNGEEAEVINVIDPDQEREIGRTRQRLLRYKRKRKSQVRFDLDEPPARRLRSGLVTRRDAGQQSGKQARLMDVMSDDHLVTIFSHLSPFPDLLRVRQVCKRWHRLSCDSRLWKSLSFTNHEYVNSTNLETLCKNTPAFRNLRYLSLARIHGVSEAAVRAIPRAACSATLQSVDLSWCSGASDKSVVEFSRCPGLRELRLAHCRAVTRRSVRILAVRCPRLEVLDINCISKVRDSLLEVLGQNCPYLKVLNLADARGITDEGLAFVAKGCVRLEVLDLSWCRKITDWAVSRIANNLPKLREVGLSETKVTDVGIAELTRNCKNLQALHLARCAEITDSGVQTIIEHCSERITSLNLASCHNVSDGYVERLIRVCPKLNCLDVSKLPCRTISDMLLSIDESRNLQVYF